MGSVAVVFGTLRCSCSSWLPGGNFDAVVHGPALTAGPEPNRLATFWLSTARPTTSAPKYCAITASVERTVFPSPAVAFAVIVSGGKRSARFGTIGGGQLVKPGFASCSACADVPNHVAIAASVFAGPV